jgi:signal transduction histidine kinase
MGAIVVGLGLSVYRGIYQTHVAEIDRELTSITATLADRIELKLTQPGQLTPAVKKVLPNLRANQDLCSDNARSIQPQMLNEINYECDRAYYVRFHDLNKRLVAESGLPPSRLSPNLSQLHGQLLTTPDGQKYYLVVALLQTQNRQNWGYLEVGRKLTDLDRDLWIVGCMLMWCLPVALIFVGLASWWLAKLAMQPIYQSYRQMQQFTADAAHELRTPLAATQATLESALLQPKLDDRDVRDVFSAIQRQNVRLSQLVADLLLLTRMEREARSKPSTLCCLNEIVYDLAEELAALAIKAQVRLETAVDNDPINILGDPDRLYRLVSNLIINAIQYTPAGGKVLVNLERRERQVILSVSDTGIGIPAEAQTHVFDRFYRVNTDRSRHNGGSGLGLAIAKSIVEYHRGQISVRSEIDKYSTFMVTLPVAQL